MLLPWLENGEADAHHLNLCHLPDFLDHSDWAEFISYYILSREVDALFVGASECGSEPGTWLQNTFPEMEVVDGAHMEELNFFGGM